MIYELPANSLYGDRPIPIRFPDYWDVHISKFAGYDTTGLSRDRIADRIHDPVGAQPISEGAKGAKSAVIIIDDITRPTPCEPIARAVVNELLSAGVPKENIWFIVALGTHGCMYREQFVRKLGDDLVEEFEVHNHNLFFNHVFLGNTTNNVPVEINADVMSADYKIGIGTTMAHSYFGFSGGAKCILPGISSLRTITKNHSFTTTAEFNMGNPHTLMRSDAEQAARMAGLDFKIDAILNGKAEICQLFAGDFEAEVKLASEYAAKHYLAKFVPDCDIVLSNNYFKPAEASCAFTPEVIASLRDGGSFILAANSPFGPCVHYLYDKWGHSSPGGMMWSGCYTKGKTMKDAVVFAEHTVKGMRDAWYIDEHSGAVFIKEWDKVLEIVDDGLPKKIVIYPNAECQILDKSKEFYKKS
jgi:nickel-dependent lactate racemase